jgi:Flp pilus assembly pilin Flp
VTHVNDVFLKVLIEVQRLAGHLRSERGQDTLEWAMLSGLVAISIVLVLALMTGALSSLITGISNCIDFNSTTTCLPNGTGGF